MAWTVKVKNKAKKNLLKLPAVARNNFLLLLREMEDAGPVRGNWPNYSKLDSNKHHCHIKGGQPTYVVVWEEVGGKINLIEVTYAGTHEKAPY